MTKEKTRIDQAVENMIRARSSLEQLENMHYTDSALFNGLSHDDYMKLFEILKGIETTSQNIITKHA